MLFGWFSLGFLIIAIVVSLFTIGPKSRFNGKGSQAGAEGILIFVFFGLGSAVVSLILLIAWLAVI